MQLKKVLRRWGRSRQHKNNSREQATTPSNNHIPDNYQSRNSNVSQSHHSPDNIHPSDDSSHGSSALTTFLHRCASQVGLDEFIESRRGDCDFATRMVNIEVRLFFLNMFLSGLANELTQKFFLSSLDSVW